MESHLPDSQQQPLAGSSGHAHFPGFGSPESGTPQSAPPDERIAKTHQNPVAKIKSRWWRSNGFQGAAFLGLICLVFVWMYISGRREVAECKEHSISVPVGDQNIFLPIPDGLAPTGSEQQIDPETVKKFVPANNRLLTAFIPAAGSPGFGTSSSAVRWPRWGIAEVSRQAEGINISDRNFQEIRKEMMAALNSRDMSNSSAASGTALPFRELLNEGTNYACFSIEVDAVDQRPGTPASAVTIPGSATMILVKHKIVMLYLYADPNDLDAKQWVRTLPEKWVYKLNTANRE